MIIGRLIQLIYNLLSNLLVFGLPSLPESVMTQVTNIKSYFVTGIHFLTCFIPLSVLQYLAVLLGLVIALNSAYIIYSLAFWVIRKFPFLNVKE